MGSQIKSVGIGVILGVYTGGAALANPTGAEVVHGDVSISAPDPFTLEITNSPSAIINWQDFSIGEGEITRFIQQNSDSAVLNQVVGNNLSEIYGTLSSNGRVFLINPNGIVFGESAIIDTAGLIASSLNLDNQDFLDGKFNFSGENAGAVINRGVIAAGPGGEVVLIAPQIENTGSIQVQDGQLILAAGESVTLTSWDLDGVEFEVQAPDNNILNLGQLIAEKGAVGLFAGSIQHEGVIAANSLSVDEAGNIVLAAQSHITVGDDAIVDASGAQGGSITIQSETGDAVVRGEVTAVGSEAEGGHIAVLGERVGLFGEAVVDASGRTGGGEVLVGGDFQGQGDTQTATQTQLGADTSIHADALESGDGGKAIVWADGYTEAHGTVTARGGEQSGNGGLIEVSGKESLLFMGQVDTLANNGDAGTILFDPRNITIDASASAYNSASDGFTESPSADVTIGSDSLATAVQSGNVILQANNDINWGGTNFTVSNTANNSLTLEAGRSINVFNTIGEINTDGGDLVLIANSDSASLSLADRTAGAGNIWIGDGAQTATINTAGGGLTFEVRNGVEAGSIVIDDGASVLTNGGIARFGVASSSTATFRTAANVSLGGGSIQTMGGDLRINADNIDLQGAISVHAGASPGTANVELLSADGSANILLGSADTTTEVGLTDTELDTITMGDGTLSIGRSTQTGDIIVQSTITPATASSLVLETTGTIDFAQSGVDGIDLSTGSVSLIANQITNSAPNTPTDDVDVRAATASLTGVAGIGATNGINLAADTVQFDNTGTGDVFLYLQPEPSSGGVTINGTNTTENITLFNSGGGTGAFNINNVEITDAAATGTINIRQSGSAINIGQLLNQGSGDIYLQRYSTNTLSNGINMLSAADLIQAVSGDVVLASDTMDFSACSSCINAGGSIGIISATGASKDLVIGTGTPDGSTIAYFDTTNINALGTASSVIFGRTPANSSATINNLQFGANADFSGKSFDVVLSSGGTLSLLGNSVNVGANNLMIETDAYNTGGGTLQGTGNLSFTTNTISNDITVGFSASPTGLYLDNSAVTSFTDGFSLLEFKTSGIGNVNTGSLTLNDSVHFNSSNAVNVGGSITMAGADSVTIDGSSIDLAGSIVTSGGAVTLNAPTTVSASVGINTANGANVTFGGTVDDNGSGNNLTVNAGTGGIVQLGGNIGSTTALNAFTITASGGVQSNASSYTVNNTLTFNGPVTLNANTVMTSTSGTANIFDGVDAATGAETLNVAAGSTARIQGGAGQTTALASVTASGTSIQLDSVNTSGAQSYTGPVTLSGDLTTAGANLTVNGNLVVESSALRTLDTGSGAGNIQVTGDITGSSSAAQLAMTAGTGDIDLASGAGTQQIGTAAANALTDLSLSGANISLEDIGSLAVTGVTGTLDITATNDINFVTSTGSRINAGAQTYSAGNNIVATADTQLIANTNGDAIQFSSGNISSTGIFNVSTNNGLIDLSGATFATDASSSNAYLILNSNGGNINVAGMGAAGGNTRFDGATINAGTGDVTLSGVMDTGNIAGNQVLFSGGTITLTSSAAIATDNTTNDGNVSLTADQITLNGGSIISTGTATTTLDTVTSSTVINLGSGSGFVLTDAELDLIFSDTIQVGSAGNTGGIVFNGALTQSGKNFTLNTSGAITSPSAAATDITANQLSLQNATGVGTSADHLNTNVTTITGTSAGDLFVDEANALIVSSLNTTGSVALTNASGNMLVDQVRSDGDVSLQATNGALVDANSGVGNRPNVDGYLANVGDVSLTALSGIGSASSVFELSKIDGTVTANNTGTSGDIYLASVAAGASGLQLGAINNNSATGVTDIINNVASDAVSVGGVITVANDLSLGSNNGPITLGASVTAGGNAQISAGTGTVAVNAALSAADLGINAGSISQASSGNISSTGLADFNTVTGMDLTTATGNSLTQVQASNSTSGNIAISNAGALEVAGTGVINSAGDISLSTSAGTLTTNADVRASAGNLSLTTNGSTDDISINRSLEAGLLLAINSGNNVSINGDGAAGLSVMAGTGLTIDSQLSGTLNISGGTGTAEYVHLETSGGNIDIGQTGIFSSISVSGGDGGAIVGSTAVDSASASIYANGNLNVSATNAVTLTGGGDGTITSGDGAYAEMGATGTATISSASMTLQGGTGAYVESLDTLDQAAASARVSAGVVNLSVTSGNLDVLAGSGQGASAEIRGTTSLAGSVSGDVNLAANGADAEVSLSSAGSLDLDATGAVSLQGGGSSNAMATIGGGTVIDIDAASVSLTGGAGAGSGAAIGCEACPSLTINIGSAAAIGGDVVLNGGSGTGAFAAIGNLAPNGSTPGDVSVNVIATGDVTLAGNTGGTFVGAKEDGGTGRAVNASISIEAGAAGGDGTIDLGDALLQAGTNAGSVVKLAAHNSGALATTEGRVIQSAGGSIIAPQLYVETYNDDVANHVNLSAGSNDVDLLAIRNLDAAGTGLAAGSISYTDIDGVSIDGSALGLSAGETALQGSGTSNFAISAGDAITQAADANSAIQVGYLETTSVNGQTLTNLANALGFFGASNTGSGDIHFVEAGGFTVGANALIAGINNAVGSVVLESTGNITQATGADDQIVANALKVTTLNNSGALVTLNHASNDVNQLTIRTLDSGGTTAANGAIQFTDVDDFAVGAINLITGEKAIETAGSVTLAAGGAVSQLTTAEDAVQVGGALNVTTQNDAGAVIQLNNTNNSITGNQQLLVLNTAGTVAAAGTIDVFNTAATILGDVKTAANATIQSSDAISQQAGKTLEVSGLTTLTGNNGVDASEAANLIAQLNVSNATSGDIFVRSNQSWTVDALNTATAGAITLVNLAGDMTVNSVVSDGAVSLTSAMGAMTDGNGALVNIAGDSANLSSNLGMGSGDALELDLVTSVVAVNSTSGHLELEHTRTGTALGVYADNTASTGDVVITSSAADADINISGSVHSATGSAIVTTSGANSDVLVDAVGNIVADAGNVTITAQGGVVQNGDIASGVTAGIVVVQALNGDITMGSSAQTLNSSTGSSTTYSAANNITAAVIDGGAGSVSLSATGGAISDGNGAAANITAASVDLVSATGVDLDLSHAGALLVNQALATTGGDILLSNLDAAGSLELAGDVNAGGANAVVLEAANGDIQQTAGSIIGNSVTANAGGDISLNNTNIAFLSATAAGALTVNNQVGDLIVDTAQSTGSGDVNLTAAGVLTVADGGSGVSAANGSVVLTSQGMTINRDVTASNNLTLNAGSGVLQLEALSGSVLVEASGGTADLTAGSMAMAATAGAVSLKAADVNVTTTSGDVSISAGTAAGQHAVIESTPGDVNITSANAISLTAPGGANDADALIKANGGAGTVSLQNNESQCTGCVVTTETANADVGVIGNLLTLLNGFANWVGGSTQWSDTGNWASGILPGLSDDVNIATNGGPAINVDTVVAIDSLVSDTDLVIGSGGSLAVTTDTNISATLQLNGGDVSLNGASDSINAVEIADFNSELLVNGGLTVNSGFTMNAGLLGGAGTVNITPTLNWDGGEIFATTTAAGGVAAGGTSIRILSGTLDATAGFTQTGGQTHLNNGDLQVTSASVDGGSVTGDGTVTGNIAFTNALLAPGSSTGQITINGNLDMTDSVLQAEIAGLNPGEYDQVHATGGVTLSGSNILDVDIIDPYLGTIGDQFEPLISDVAISGVFASKSFTNGYGFRVDELADKVMLELEQIPGDYDSSGEISDLIEGFEEEVETLEAADEEEEYEEWAEEEEQVTNESGTLVCR